MARRLALALVLSSLPALAAAAGPTRWFCAYAPSEGEAVLCQLVETPAEGVTPMPLPASHARLPRIVSDIRNAPSLLDDRLVVIPLHSPPIDMASAGRLARNVMCGDRPDCAVEFRSERQGLVHATVAPRPRRR